MDGGRESIRFLVKLARGLHAHGTPAHRIEQALEVATARLGIPGRFFSLPTVILGAFGEPEQRSTGLIRVQPGSIHLEKLVLLDDVLKDLVRGKATPEQAAARVDAVEELPERYPPVVTLAAFAAVSASAALFFAGGVREIALAALLGALAGALGLRARRSPALERVQAPLTAFAVSLLALAASARIGGVSSYVVTVSSLVVLLPGLALTIAISELAARSLVSGSVRLVSALVALLELVFGVALGRGIAARAVGEVPSFEPATLPAWTEAAALLLAPCAFVVLFRARPRDLAPILATGVVGVVAARAGAHWVGEDLGGFFGAFAAGFASNLYARWRDRPVAVAVMPGILLLVPGGVGFRSLTLLLERDVVSGVEAAFRMVLVAMSIVAGLLFANVLAPARKPI